MDLFELLQSNIRLKDSKNDDFCLTRKQMWVSTKYTIHWC